MAGADLAPRNALPDMSHGNEMSSAGSQSAIRRLSEWRLSLFGSWTLLSNGCVRLIGRLIGFDVGFNLRKGAWATFFAASGGVEGAMPRRCVSGTAIV